MILETTNLTKLYGKIIALDQLTLKVPDGAVGLLGPNGAGKTTLIKLLLGLTPATNGSGTVLGRDIQTSSLEIRQKIGYMPENDCFIPDMNAVSHLTYLGQLSGLSYHDAMQRTHEALYYVKIGDERYREIATYSSGMKQKIKLAQALVHDPELIFLDEPTTGLDPSGRREMLNLIKGVVKDQKKNILFSSHILTDIEHICDQVVILNFGKLIKMGKLQDLLYEKEPDLVVRIRGDVDNFVKTLKESGLEPHKRKNDILIKYAPGVSKRVIELTAQTGVQLRHLDRSKRSLDELFINLIDQTDQS
ncbi:MAG: ABC transporter ATP-binding protein [Thermoplasmata archaeon]|nr:ABC transporter ATP-binding protein [Thermoplasmata archaeon]